MAGEEPEIGIDIEFGDDLALAILSAFAGDVGDAVHHKHGGKRKLGVAGAEKPALSALDQTIIIEAGRVLGHESFCLMGHLRGGHACTPERPRGLTGGAQ
ncbi:hypothetical protein GCM10007420_24240 [Glycocaulis albus]|uniref:Uncharacterized protein n=1 Tax=Glycocaulis albus TaxID=1382801 RepID=A0ABQ1XY97_9PROT|nr:hypothetical protein GCM10007420_24240 [Glycocaulis albus]